MVVGFGYCSGFEDGYCSRFGDLGNDGGDLYSSGGGGSEQVRVDAHDGRMEDHLRIRGLIRSISDNDQFYDGLCSRHIR